jgi:Na+/H+ antiporter NhaD/arsenite permease-like protein
MSNRILLKAAAIIPIIFLMSMLFSATVPAGKSTVGKLMTITASASEHAPETAPAVEHAAEAVHEGEEAHEEGAHGHGPINMSILWIIPFAGILLSIAIIPLINGHWWHHNFPKVSLLFGIPMAVAMFIMLQTKTIHTFVEYCSFIALVGSLFVISGGILVRGSFKSSPMTNTVFLIIGSVIASFIGTAGASMVLIRPMLRINRNRKTKLHIFIFFIFAVSNIGGSLTPLGDPPLFLGFLQGVPFEWTLIHMLPGWAFAIGILMALFYVVDSMMVKKDGGIPADDPNEPKQKFAILGSYNFIFLLGVMGTVIFYGTVLRSMENLGFIRDAIQVGLMALMALLSMVVTPKPLREENGFSWFPVKEVAILFAAIFACMIPALNILEYKGETGALTLTHAWQYFWMTGGLSSFLDNAPTYLTFLSLGKTIGGAGCVAVYGGCVPQHILLAIAMGAVFFGAMSYIGNAPNFMVKSICEENKVPMPSFLGYMVWSIGILVPIFAIVTFIFFRG